MHTVRQVECVPRRPEGVVSLLTIVPSVRGRLLLALHGLLLAVVVLHVLAILEL